jgi:glucose-6-phosphate 1-epimerase
VSTRIRFEERAPGVRIVHIENKAAVAAVSLFGGQLLSWQPRRETQAVLWMSSLAKFDGKTAIRGGVPICWPWFGKHPSSSTATAHGYARLSNWNLEHIDSRDDGSTELVMALPREAQSGENRQPGLGNSIRLVIGDTLDIESTTRNDSKVAQRVTEALHTYFQVSDVAQVQVSGLSGCDYADLLDDNRIRRQDGNIRFGEEVGRIFVRCDKASVIEDSGLRRRIHVTSRGSHSIAVWNPGLHTASKMTDLGSEAWRSMVCVETANVLDDAIDIPAGEQHTLSARYAVEALA